MNEATISVSDFLNELFQKRRSLNPRYSQRAFARDLGLSSGRLSEYLSDKNIPGPSSIEALRTRLSLDDEQYKALLQAVEHSKSMSAEKSKPVVLEPHQFSIISDWEHFAVMSLTQTKDFRADEAWIAQRLGIEVSRATQVLLQLETAGLIERQENGIVSHQKNVTTTHDIPSEMIRKSHQQKINLALKSLQQHPVNIRDISSITMPINPDDLAEAKQMIVQFRRKLANTFGKSNSCSEVYCLNVQLFPLTQKHPESATNE